MSDLKEEIKLKKEHLSFSEIKDWLDCSRKHKLKHIDGIDLSEDSVYTCFGSAIHASNEDYLKTRVMKVEIALQMVRESWEKNKFPDMGLWMKRVKNILDVFPEWLEKTFPNWEYVSAEEELFEEIPNSINPNIKYKGFIDAIIKHDGYYYILDYKTSGLEGWSDYKRNDENTKLQLIYYNLFWSLKNIELKDKIKCGFVLLNRETGLGARVPIELVLLDVLEPHKRKGLEIINNIISSVRLRRSFKIVKDSRFGACKFCEYNDTKYCPDIIKREEFKAK